MKEILPELDIVSFTEALVYRSIGVVSELQEIVLLKPFRVLEIWVTSEIVDALSISTHDLWDVFEEIHVAENRKTEVVEEVKDPFDNSLGSDLSFKSDVLLVNEWFDNRIHRSLPDILDEVEKTGGHDREFEIGKLVDRHISLFHF